MDSQKLARYSDFFRDPDVGDNLLGVGDRGIACDNLRLALGRLGYPAQKADGYDANLEKCVTAFQKEYKHNVVDGYVGPGTRQRLARVLLEKFGDAPFQDMKPPGQDVAPSVFLCYSHADSEVVDKVDQWLQDKGVRVWRDKRDIPPGSELTDVVKAIIREADKVVVVYSRQAKGHDWPEFEISVAREVERDGRRVLIYLVLDDTPLPQYDTSRVAVMAKGRKLRDVGQDLLYGISGRREWTRVPYDEDEVLV